MEATLHSTSLASLVSCTPIRAAYTARQHRPTVPHEVTHQDMFSVELDAIRRSGDQMSVRTSSFTALTPKSASPFPRLSQRADSAVCTLTPFLFHADGRLVALDRTGRSLHRRQRRHLARLEMTWARQPFLVTKATDGWTSSHMVPSPDHSSGRSPSRSLASNSYSLVQLSAGVGLHAQLQPRSVHTNLDVACARRLHALSWAFAAREWSIFIIHWPRLHCCTTYFRFSSSALTK